MEEKLISTLALLLATCLSEAAGQPVGCTHKDQCGSGYYCVKETWMCSKCIECEDFKRNPPLTPMECVTSVVDCGSCFDGLLENVQGDLREPCVPAEAGAPAFLWVGVGLGALLLLLLAAVAVVIYVLRHTDLFPILASTRTSVQSGCVNGAAATAPELPPPYNTLYSPVRPDSPAAPPLIADEESASPFIKPPPAPGRESAGNQAANYYNNPNYVRGPHLPSNYHAAERDPEPEYLQDETTVESQWTPTDTANNNTTDDNSESSSSGAASASASASGSAPLSAALAAARNTTLLRPPCQDAATPNKQPRLRQDTNNNRNNRDPDDDAPLPRAGPTVNILVNVQQLNDVKL